MRHVFRGTIYLGLLVTLAACMVTGDRERSRSAVGDGCQPPVAAAKVPVSDTEPTPASSQAPTLAPPQPPGSEHPVEQALYLSVETEHPEIEVVLIDP